MLWGLQPSFRGRHWSNAGLHSPVPALAPPWSADARPPVPKARAGSGGRSGSCMPARALARYDGVDVNVGGRDGAMLVEIASQRTMNPDPNNAAINQSWAGIVEGGLIDIDARLGTGRSNRQAWMEARDHASCAMRGSWPCPLRSAALSMGHRASCSGRWASPRPCMGHQSGSWLRSEGHVGVTGPVPIVEPSHPMKARCMWFRRHFSSFDYPHSATDYPAHRDYVMCASAGVQC